MDKYIKDLALKQYNDIKGYKIIYLDINYWIKVIDADSENNKPFVNALKNVSSKCIFPVSDMVFYELLKQKDFSKLMESINLIEELSKGVCFVAYRERVCTEINHFFYSKFFGDVYGLHKLSELVWTKPGFLLGCNSINFNFDISDYTRCIEMSKITLSELLVSYKEMFGTFLFKDNINQLNIDKGKYQNENNTFKGTYLSELGGLLLEFEDDIKQAVFHIFNKQRGRFPTREEEMLMEIEKYRHLIYNSFKLGKMSVDLPFFNIFCQLFASVRRDTRRKFKDGNDTMDFLHAAIALPYCDYFFTEHELKHRIKERDLDELYGCRVESDYHEVVILLDQINKY